MKIKLQKIVGNLLDRLVRECKSHLERFSRPHVIGNSRRYLLLRTATDILQKTLVGCPC